jgi:putative ABC transport system permease protein
VGLHPEKIVGLRIRIMSKSHFSPPPLAERLLDRTLEEGERAARLGDIEERFQFLAREQGGRRARAWYRGQVLQLVILAVINHFFWSGIMFKNNLVIAWRNIKRNKVYSALNILGLATGLAVFILIMLFVRTELSYDRYHVKHRDIYRVILDDPDSKYLGSNLFAVTPGPLAPAMVRDFPEVLEAGRIDRSWNALIGIGDKYSLEKTIHWADPQIFKIFSFPIVRGEKTSVLEDPFSALLSERAAQRLFGSDDPIGRTIRYHVSNAVFEFRISAVFRDIPSRSHFVMDIVVPFETLAKVHKNDLALWSDNTYYTYVLLRDDADPRAVNGKLPAFIEKHTADQAKPHRGQPSRYLLQPLSRIHLNSGINFELSPTGDARFVFLFASIAVLVLIIACVNYMNLATARSLKRAKEVGLRKVVGAGRSQLVRQFLGDSTVLTFIALILAVGIVLAALPAFRAFVEREIAFNPLRDIVLMPGLVLLAAAVGAIAGSYPAFFVSAFRPVSALKGAGARTGGRGLRSALIVFQFAASITLIICTAGVRSQLSFIRNRDMGYDRAQIVVLSPRGGLRTNLAAFKMELKRNPSILGVAASSSLPNNVNSTTVAKWPGKPDDIRIPIYFMEADEDFADLYGLEISRGRNFSSAFPSDIGGAFLINESAVKALGWRDPVGRAFNRNDKTGGTIVGVIRDFHMHSLHLPIMPLYIFDNPKVTGFGSINISIKIRGEHIPETLANIRKAWESFAPEYPFEYTFFDEIFNRAYRAERRLETMFSVFAGLAIFIACLGLIGLASFTAEQKTREIGIRKILGASSSAIIFMLSHEFMKWVVVANLMAWPIGYLAMRSWLRNFAYRTNLSVPMFLGAALATLVIASAVIGLQTYRAATSNPAQSMRHE